MWTNQNEKSNTNANFLKAFDMWIVHNFIDEHRAKIVDKINELEANVQPGDRPRFSHSLTFGGIEVSFADDGICVHVAVASDDGDLINLFHAMRNVNWEVVVFG